MINILVTGSAGFVGKNLVAALRNIRDGKDRTRGKLEIGDVFEYDLTTSPELLCEYCQKANFVFHFAGVNRPEKTEEFMQGNRDFTASLLDMLKQQGNTCPIVISSSVQASCIGRYDSDYGRSKRASEELAFAYGEQTGAKVMVYRFTNLFGKWCRPNYNSVVATFCHNVSHDLPITVSDPNIELELAYIDDLVDEMISALGGNEHRCKDDARYCIVPTTHRVTLGKIADLLGHFHRQPKTLIMPEIPDGSFEKKLYSTYLSYLPKEKVAFELDMKADERGSFTELLKTANCGQFSVNISKPGVTKGQHWHNSKWELFIVVSGRALIEQRRIDSDEVISFVVSGDKIEAVHMLPGYTHSIKNLSDSDNLVTLMWANEQFDASHPDTFFETV